MPILSYDQVFQRRSKVVKVEHAMGVEPLTTVQRNPLIVYTRRRRLKPISCTSNGDEHVQCDNNIMAESIGQQTVAGPAEVGQRSRKRPRSPYCTRSISVQLGLDPSTPLDNFCKSSIGSNQDSTTTDDKAVVSDENVQSEEVMNAPKLHKRSCRRSLHFNEENQNCHVNEKEVIPAPCKYGCLREIKRMEPILFSTCRRKRVQITRLRKILLLAHWMLPNVPRNCKKKRSSRQKNAKISWSALICYRSDKINKKTSAGRMKKATGCLIPKTKPKPLPARIRKAIETLAPNHGMLGGNGVPSSVAPQKNDHFMSSVNEDPSFVAPKPLRKQVHSPKPRIRKAPKNPNHVTSIGENEVPSSIAAKKTKVASPKIKKSSPKIKKSKKKTDELEDFRNMDIESAIQIVVLKLISLSIDDDEDDGAESGMKLPCKTENGMIVPYKEKLKPPKVLLDPQTLKVWNRTMFPEDGEALDPDEEEQWKHERELFSGRVDSFIARMHLTLGPRRFMPWKGSVVDSVVGVFLTQNVSDYLSSNAYLSLCSKFPKFNVRASENKGPILEDKSEDRVKASEEVRKETELNDEELRLKAVNENMEQEEIVNKKLEEDMCGKEEYVKIEEVEDMREQLSPGTGEREIPSASVKEKKKKKKVDKRVPIDWKNLRETVMNLFSHEPRSEDHMDTVDWEKVRNVSPNELADTIKDRGQQNELAKKIQEFLNGLVSRQGSIDLEWLRHCPPLKVKDYLLEVNGLGLKSVECVRLLALQHVAFPVDVNVGRIAIRLGWVPLEPMPESLQLHLLDKYPLMDEIQKYLWPRLCTIDQRTLYELHYHLITFGKVFCTKKKPNCHACPLKVECKHFASVHSSAKLGLPAPPDNSMVASTNSIAVDKNLSTGSIEFVADGDKKHACEPIVEEPESPKSEDQLIINSIIKEPRSPTSENQSLLVDTDIEDLCKNDGRITSSISNYRSLMEMDIEDLYKDDVISTINLSSIQSKATYRRIKEQDLKAMVALSPEAASYPMRKLKAESRLRTEHQVYELPDGHPLIAEFEPREVDDPCPYLLAIWPNETASTHEGSCHSTEEHKTETIRGTILIPCRTATRSRFPLNGTYFQVNEVFADDESSNHPIDVPRDLIWNLTRRTAYAGTSALSIFRGLSFIETCECFWRGFICVRGFDRKTRGPKPLSVRFHLSLKYTKEQKGASLRRKNVEKEQKDHSLDKKKGKEEEEEEEEALKKSSVYPGKVTTVEC